MRSHVPTRRLGTPFQRPAWRYDALRNPDKYGFRSFCSRKADNAGCLRRLIKKGLDCRVTYIVPRGLTVLAKRLPASLAAELKRVWHKHWLKNNSHKVLIENIDQYENLVSWNAAKLGKINDEWFQKLIRHICNLDYSPEIDAALRLHLSEEYEQIKRYIGHLIFAKVDDAEISRQWNIPAKTITALRMLFFDFSALPKDPVAQWATLVQWVNNGDIKPDEFALYRRVHELGALGLKAQVAGSFLGEDERLKVHDYLTKSALANTYNIQFSTRSPRDAIVYNRVIGDLVRMDLQREETNLRRSEQKLLEMQVQKLANELNTDKAQELQSEDLRLIQTAITALAKQDCEPRYKTVFDLVTKK